MFTDSYPQLDFHYDGDSVLMAILAVTLLVLLILMHLACGIAILESANRYSEKHGSTVLLARSMWGFIGFLGGPWGLGLYWFVHLSTLNPAQSAATPNPPATLGA